MNYRPLSILNDRFGYQSFRLHQEAIINAVLEKRDAFVLMPTGGGKSLCYQVPALCFEGLTIVISPLIALMKDQVDALTVNGIEAAYINSTQNVEEQDVILNKAKSGKLKLLYLAPEKILGNAMTFLSTLKKFNISLVAIDEAHCISHWGHDFRPEYLMLAKLKEALPNVPFIALTATADQLTRADIVEKLQLNDPAIFVSSFNRTNIRYSVEPKKNHFERLIHFLELHPDDSGIIYCLSRKSTEQLVENLRECGFDALAYHAGMDRAQRSRHQEMFLRDEVKIIVATIAFGMGINKSNVRYVVHMDLPKNIEGYYQETGRAGRDGLDSEALLFYSVGDVIKMKKFAQIEGNEQQTAIALKKLEQMGEFGQLTTCRRQYLLNYFNEDAFAYCGNCDVCLREGEVYDATEQAQKVLSAIVRLNESYGAGFIIDFLRGSESTKISEEQKLLKTYGAGRDMSKDDWKKIVRELVDNGYIGQTGGAYPLLHTNEKSQRILSGAEKVMLPKPKNASAARNLSHDDLPYDNALFQRLKDLRRELATHEDVPAYVILSDASLRELSTYLPMNIYEIEKISGFGVIKIEKYGERFSAVVAEYCREHGLTSRIDLKGNEKKVSVPKQTNTKEQTLALFTEGKSVQQIATARGMQTSTIETHLAFYVERGEIKLDSVMKRDKVSAIADAILKFGEERLSPIKQHLGNDYSYGEIKWVIADRKRSEALTTAQ